MIVGAGNHRSADHSANSRQVTKLPCDFFEKSLRAHSGRNFKSRFGTDPGRDSLSQRRPSLHGEFEPSVKKPSIPSEILAGPGPETQQPELQKPRHGGWSPEQGRPSDRIPLQ